MKNIKKMAEIDEPIDIINADRRPLYDPILEAVLNVWGQKEEQHFIPITGCSMLPLIRSGDIVLVEHGCTGVRLGDIVVFRFKSKLIAHRVLHKYEGNFGPIFITKGDNVLHFDPPISNKEIVGRVLTIKRGVRYMSLDTTIFRVLGYFIAGSTLATAKVYNCGRNLKQRIFGSHSSPFLVHVHQGAHVLFLLIRKIIFFILCKWK
ncbi:signal peptidase I [Methylococcales bacterium]|nr:signal peptidase I [Methylococcales bacterium]